MEWLKSESFSLDGISENIEPWLIPANVYIMKILFVGCFNQLWGSLGHLVPRHCFLEEGWNEQSLRSISLVGEGICGCEEGNKGDAKYSPGAGIAGTLHAKHGD